MVPVIVAAPGARRGTWSAARPTRCRSWSSQVAPLALPGSPPYVTLALTLSLCHGHHPVRDGAARLGALVNFISHTVIVGFTAGAGLLIIASQLRHFFGIPIEPGAGFSHRRADDRAFRELDPAITATGA